MLTELSLIIVSYLGIFIGSYLYKVAGQEVVDNKEEIFYFQQILGMAAYVCFAVFLPVPIAEKLIAAALVATLGYFMEDHYPLAGLMVGINPTFLVSSLVFLYGFPHGSLLHTRSFPSVLKKTYMFLLLGIIGLIIKEFFFI